MTTFGAGTVDAGTVDAVTGNLSILSARNGNFVINKNDSEVDLSNCDLNDEKLKKIVKYLASMENLTKLNLRKNQIIDFEQISLLTKLVWLDVSENEIADIQSINALSNLSWLSLSGNKIGIDLQHEQQNLRALNSLQALTYLDLSSNNHITGESLKLLSLFQHLKKLDLTNNGITDISPLCSSNSLNSLSESPIESLDIRQNEITDIRSIDALKNIKELLFDEEKIEKDFPTKPKGTPGSYTNESGHRMWTNQNSNNRLSYKQMQQAARKAQEEMVQVS